MKASKKVCISSLVVSVVCAVVFISVLVSVSPPIQDAESYTESQCTSLDIKVTEQYSCEEQGTCLTMRALVELVQPTEQQLQEQQLWKKRAFAYVNRVGFLDKHSVLQKYKNGTTHSCFYSTLGSFRVQFSRPYVGGGLYAAFIVPAVVLGLSAFTFLISCLVWCQDRKDPFSLLDEEEDGIKKNMKKTTVLTNDNDNGDDGNQGVPLETFNHRHPSSSSSSSSSAPTTSTTSDQVIDVPPSSPLLPSSRSQHRHHGEKRAAVNNKDNNNEDDDDEVSDTVDSMDSYVEVDLDVVAPLYHHPHYQQHQHQHTINKC
eukprot:TRINITY_DN251_c0_g1_i1.p1 TRINITY_DN251_c0_g1~~TRINITY_DN251_c0_g1_i1.p1  ORF type:complete len:316 (+),score=76.71 TRINITY_DN251_c0_g1_i1:100-1047(+)